jgi:hypothetical protein
MSRYLSVTVLALGLLSLVACNGTQPAGGAHPPSDVGNMAYPAPLPQGSVTTTTAPARP